ncbi:MAG: S8 family serine peptidase, partial [Candidatus Omnitrophica bacterium]|nr:S8 family serine peptidase [Candidatus Omnitrophota bacterium]
MPEASSESPPKPRSWLLKETDNGADVLSNSWGTNADIQAINDAFRRAHSAGCVVIAAAGNSNSPVESVSPANIPEVIAVGASDHLDAKADFSNWGWKLDVLAPGGDSANFSDPNHTYINILSLRANGTDMYGGGGQIVGTNYYRARGTSMAAPHVSGVAALMLAHRPQLTNEDIRTLLRASADDIGATGRELTTGFGRVNALRALQTPLTPFLYLQSSQISDAPSVGGNGDGFINPGETVSLRLTIKNGGLNTTGGTATLTSKQAWMSVLPATVSFGPVNRSSVQIVAFQLRISPSAPAFGRVALQLQLTAQGMSNRFEQLADLG